MQLWDIDGIDLLAAIRKRYMAPILVLSSNGDIKQKIMAYQTGADDFLKKPFEIEECLLRVHALIRRYLESDVFTKENNNIISFGALTINNACRKVFYKEKNRVNGKGV